MTEHSVGWARINARAVLYYVWKHETSFTVSCASKRPVGVKSRSARFFKKSSYIDQADAQRFELGYEHANVGMCYKIRTNNNIETNECLQETLLQSRTICWSASFS
jgi:hypothetical protein